MSHFKFDETSHVYEAGGHQVPSVTQVLEHAGLSPDFSFLDPFYLERGSAIHKAVALDLKGQLDESTLDERIVPFVEHARNWVETLGVTPLVVEFKWVHTELGYGGTLDLFCESKLGPLLIDWKAAHYDPAYDVQVAGGYRPLLIEAAEHGAVPIDASMVKQARVAIVNLKPEIPKTHWVHVGRNPDIFQSALAVSRWRTSNKR